MGRKVRSKFFFFGRCFVICKLTHSQGNQQPPQVQESEETQDKPAASSSNGNTNPFSTKNPKEMAVSVKSPVTRVEEKRFTVYKVVIEAQGKEKTVHRR